MKRPTALKLLLTFGLLLALAVFTVFFFPWHQNHTKVRNLTGQAVTDVVLELRDHQTEWAVTNRAASLKPGGSIKIRHSHTDTTAVLQFTIAGQKFRHDEGYIDLWTGEGCHLDIQPDGTVKSGYER